jgi:hypothetical protein
MTGDEAKRALNLLTLWLAHERDACRDDALRRGFLAEITVKLDEFGANTAGESNIQVASLLSNRTKEGRVELVINSERTQLDLDKARLVHRMLGETIEAATSDTLIWRFLVEKVGLDERRAASALLDFRELRQGSKEVINPS